METFQLIVNALTLGGMTALYLQSRAQDRKAEERNKALLEVIQKALPQKAEEAVQVAMRGTMLPSASEALPSASPDKAPPSGVVREGPASVRRRVEKQEEERRALLGTPRADDDPPSSEDATRAWEPEAGAKPVQRPTLMGGMAGAPLPELSWVEKRSAQLRAQGVEPNEAWRQAEEEGRIANASPGAKRPPERPTLVSSMADVARSLTPEELARVDALAKERGVTRDEILLQIIRGRPQNDRPS